MPPATAVRVLALPARSPRPNPYNQLLTAALDEAGGVETVEFSWPGAFRQDADLLHFHWPEYFLRSRKAPWISPARTRTSLAMLRATKRRGVKIVWTAHNLTPHGLAADRPWAPYQELLRLTDGMVFLSRSSQEMFERLYPESAGLPSAVIPHGLYRGCYPTGCDPRLARERLGLPQDAVVASAIGSIEAYKSVPGLIRAFADVDIEELWLLVAGKPATPEVEREVLTAAESVERLSLHLAFIPDDQLQAYFAASDFCVLPYRQTLNSGAAVLALSFDTPVLCPAAGSLCELADMAGEEWVKTYAGDFSPSVLSDALDWAGAPRSASAELPQMHWDHVAKLTREFYRRIASGDSTTR